MKLLRKLWNFSFDSLDFKDVIVKTILYLIYGFIFTYISINIDSEYWLNLIFYIITPIIDLYVLIGMIIMYLNFFKIIK